MGTINNVMQIAKARSKLVPVPGTIYYYDFGTKNMSFKIVANDLKVNGVKNCAFMLTLYDPDLAGIDPYSENLDDNMIVKMIIEITRNPWYFLREVSRIPVEGSKPVPFILNRATLASIWLFLNGIDSYLTIARQIGKTKSMIAILLWSFLFGTSSSEFSFLCINQTKSNANLTTLKAQREALPVWMQSRFAVNGFSNKMDKGIDNKQEIYCPVSKNRIITLGKAQSIDSAREMGRGNSQPVQYIDEVEFINYILEILKASGPAFVTSAKNAKENGAIYGRIFTSTPGDLDSQPGKDAEIILEDTYEWSETFYDTPLNLLKEQIAMASTSQIVYIEYPYYYCGKDSSYFKEMCSKLFGDKIAIKREVLLQRIHGSSDSPYDPEDIDAIYELKGKAKKEIFINKLFRVKLYEDLSFDKVYFVGLDTADGYGDGDNTALVIFDPYDFKVVGTFGTTYISPTQLKNFLLVLFKKYLPRSILIPERNRAGALISDILEEEHLRFLRSRLYCEPDNNKFDKAEQHYDQDGFMIAEAMRRKFYGVYTNASTRKEMFTLLEVLVREEKRVFVADEVIKDLSNLVRKNGKIQAASGKHDDFIMAFLFTIFVYYHGAQLYRYGYYPGRLPKEEERNRGIQQYEQEQKELYATLQQQGFQQYKEADSYEKEYGELIRKYQRQSQSTQQGYGGDNYSVKSETYEYEQPSMNLSIFDDLNS